MNAASSENEYIQKHDDVSRERRARGPLCSLLLWTTFAVLLAPISVRASCNLLPGTKAAFDGDQGSLNRPFAGPGEAIEISLRGCDSSPGLGAAATDHNVTVLYQPAGATPTAVVLTADADCSSLAAEVSSCAAAIGGKAICVAGTDAGLALVDRGGTSALSLRFPATDARCNGGADAGTPCIADADCASNDCSSSIDGRTLSGPAVLAVTDSADPLACGIADCASATGTIACVDRLYAASGTCSTNDLGRTFPAFTALPSPNIYATECVDTEPPCDPLAGVEELRIGLDIHGNALLPFLWDGVREQLEGEAVARIVRATIAQDISVPGQTFVASFSPEGRKLDPVFEPKQGGGVGLTLFGSTDAPYTILRVANGSDAGLICVGGTSDGQACNVPEECPTGSCDQASCVGGADNGQQCRNDSECDGVGVCGDQLFDFSPLVVDSGQGPAVLAKDATGGMGICQNDTASTCSADCGPDGPCVSYKLEASTTVPLDGLLPRDELANFAVTERIDNLDLNNDGDTVDLVMTLRDTGSGDLIPLGAPAASCGIPADALEPVFGRAVVRSAAPPLLLPAGATTDGFLAFLEPESGQNNCDINLDDDTDDAYLRIFTTDGTQIARGTEIPADEATVINDRALAISGDNVFFRTSEPETADKRTRRASQNDDTPNTPADGASTNVEITGNGEFIVFQSGATNLITGQSNGKVSIFVKRLDDGTVRRASENFAGDDPLINCFNPSIRSDGQVAFESLAQNLETGNFEDFITDNDLDVFVGGWLGSPRRISDTNAGTDPDGNSGNASIGSWGTAFESTSKNLIAPGEDTNDKTDIYFWPNSGNKIRISDPPGVTQSNGISESPSIAEDVLVIAFESTASNLVTGDGITRDVFVYDDIDGFLPPVLEKISVDFNGGIANNVSDTAKISGDGHFVAFNSSASDLIIGDTNARRDVFVRDRWFGKTVRVSVSTGGGQANDDSDLKSISDDGRYVIFSSEATNLVSDDTNGNIDYFVHDLVARTTIRVNINSGGGQVDGEPFTFAGTYADVADNMSRIAWSADDASYSGSDTNGVTDIYVSEPQPGDPNGADLTGDGLTTLVVLRAFDLLNPPSIVNIADADAAKVAGGNALFSAVRTQTFTVEGPDVQTYLHWDGSSVTTLGYTAYPSVALSDSMFMTENVIAILNDEATLYDASPGSTEPDGDINGDGDSLDGYLVVHDTCSPITSCTWSIPTGVGGHPLVAGELLQPLGASGSTVVIAVDELNHGPSGTNLNGDTDSFDDVLQVYDAQTRNVTNLGLAVDDFVIGELIENVSGCDGDDVHLIAFRVPESTQGATNLNGVDVDPDFPPDDDPDDSVMHVHDIVSGATINVGQAARPCEFAACDPRTPYRVDGTKVVFLTLESDQGAGFGQDISGEGDFGDLVVQQYDFCTQTLTPIDRVLPNSQTDPTDTTDDSRVVTTLAGRCDSGPCTPGPGACAAGSFCETDECLAVFGLCSRHLSIGCSTNADCARCIDLYPGTCESDDDCAGAAMCLPQEITAVESALDSDGDGVNDSQDGCPNAFDPSGNDSDGDGVPDACDLLTCRPFPRGDCRQPGDGKATFMLKDGTPDKKDKLIWKWGKGEATSKNEYGNPLTSDAYELCLYSNGFLSGAAAPPGGTCDSKASKPCWKEFSKGYKYKDKLLTPQGLSTMLLKEGAAGRATIKVKAQGQPLEMPDISQISGQLVVQLVNNSTGECFDAGFNEPFKKRTADQIKAKGGVSVVTTTTTTTLPPCPDADNDGFQDAACGGLDCYDGNAQANPAQTGFFTVDRGDGSFDYDCSGIEEIRYGNACRLIAGVFCSESLPGYITVPACGVTAPRVIDCNASCVDVTSGTLTQECH